ncbi:response regulator receiver domain-containing protein [Balneicella halophila]|uniref:Response regulator receiver domain-containing protein n=1 Tax=Balneicella halophila TaxID=1537566 RepID=A0A7L4US45_BALHA|nr:bifunctional response regulator/alkaline phosphatase family protein [Balneicella halophila]PVX52241.1 response regulator receiver domain-containing protein [Balneicella halophila]
MIKGKLLWVDDEIDLLKAYIIFLEEKGYELTLINNGADAIDRVREEKFDLVLLDESMPGLSGLEVLEELKKIRTGMPVVMITKNEEEGLMDEAIGSKIADYLLKPVNPKQILHSIKKQLDGKRLVSERTTSSYQKEFTQLGMKINDCRTFDDWTKVYRDLVYWELELQRSGVSEMEEILSMQRTEANRLYGRFIKENYLEWMSGRAEDAPLTSANIFKEKLFPRINDGEKCVVVLLDNLRFDQWRTLYRDVINEYYSIEEEVVFSSILPTATHYARNAMFAGLMPRDIEGIMPDFWVNDDEDEGKNLYEDRLLETQVNRLAPGKTLNYQKVLNMKKEKQVYDNLTQILDDDVVILVYNFIDILSHSRTENNTLRELSKDEKGYRDIVKSWFKNSQLLETIKELASQKIKLIITTDHGSVKVDKPQIVQGLKEVNTNLRYKQGKHLKYDPKKVFAVTDPIEAKLPQVNVSSKYLFALDDDFFAYPNNMNHYVGYYKDTFQHGGVSLEEMLVPFVVLEPNRK